MPTEVSEKRLFFALLSFFLGLWLLLKNKFNLGANLPLIKKLFNSLIGIGFITSGIVLFIRSFRKIKTF
jgi:hypothetical protein